MKTTMLFLVCVMTLFLAIVPTEAEAQKEIGTEWLFTAPVLGDSAPICAAVNVGGSTITVELVLFNALGVQSGSTYAGLACGELAPGRVCAIGGADLPQPVYCRITVPAGRRGSVRGSIGTDALIGEAR
jgi:hypothetical protein